MRPLRLPARGRACVEGQGPDWRDRAVPRTGAQFSNLVVVQREEQSIVGTDTAVHCI